MPKSIFMENTEVPPERSAAEITSLLVQAGAQHISTEYENQRVKAIRFVMKVAEQERWFELPARTDRLLKVLADKKWNWDAKRLREAALRIGWRQLLRWVQAQLAFIETGMVKPHEPFVPYVIVNYNGQERTMFEAFEEQVKALPAASQVGAESGKGAI